MPIEHEESNHQNIKIAMRPYVQPEKLVFETDFYPRFKPECVSFSLGDVS